MMKWLLGVFHGFIWIDWILLGVCVSATVVGFLREFGYFFGRIIKSLVIVFSVMLITPPVAKWAAAHLTFAKLSFWQPFFFLVILGSTVALVKKLSGLQSKKGQVQFHPFWDRILGAALGFFWALLLTSLVSQFLIMLPFKKLQASFEKGGARYHFLLRDFAPFLVEGALTPIRAIVNQKVARP